MQLPPLSARTLPEQVVIREMGLRDGLQSIATIVPTTAKLEWIRAAYDAGQREIEVDRLLAQRAKVARWLEGETLHGSLWRAGLPRTMKKEEEAVHA